MRNNYIKRYYGVDFKIGQHVFHTETKKWGTVARSRGATHYVWVLFDGNKRSSPCHPLALARWNPIEFTLEGGAA